MCAGPGAWAALGWAGMWPAPSGSALSYARGQRALAAGNNVGPACRSAVRVGRQGASRLPGDTPRARPRGGSGAVWRLAPTRPRACGARRRGTSPAADYPLAIRRRSPSCEPGPMRPVRSALGAAIRTSTNRPPCRSPRQCCRCTSRMRICRPINRRLAWKDALL
jgi:hypothetical protein